ncbi:DUF3047 domain-containing protein [Comamonas guangdongensis]|uniref:DUF3047 domain-containing protein n=1 Tax=Comamonas guangdongensis TaxID=510515 RepID=A0ABV3ZS07_9BURK
MRTTPENRARPARTLAVCSAAALALLVQGRCLAQGDAIGAFSQMATGPLGAPWHFATLPNKAPTDFSVVELNGEHVLRVATRDAYGNMVHALHQPPSAALQLQWRWRVEQLVEQADVRTRAGDDAAIKLCVSFDYEKSQLSFGERAKLQLGRISTGEDIPAETLCYLWDNRQPVGTVLHNAFTHRLRFIVLQSGGAHLGQWITERRNLAADYLQAFGEESASMPAVIGVTVSADSDNTHGSGLAYMGDIRLQP